MTLWWPHTCSSAKLLQADQTICGGNKTGLAPPPALENSDITAEGEPAADAEGAGECLAPSTGEASKHITYMFGFNHLPWLKQLFCKFINYLQVQ